MTTAREVVAQAIKQIDRDRASDSIAQYVDYYPFVADRVLVALREHWSSLSELMRVDAVCRDEADIPLVSAVIAALFEETVAGR